ncbi:hypothetical protein RI129_002661, partial [Pyrocoelia pectoralis]
KRIVQPFDNFSATFGTEKENTNESEVSTSTLEQELSNVRQVDLDDLKEPSLYEDSGDEFIPASDSESGESAGVEENFKPKRSRWRKSNENQWKKNILKKDYNLSFFKPKKDQCLICERHKDGRVSEQDYTAHLRRRDEANSAKNSDKLRASNDKAFVSATFDLECVLQIPSSEVNSKWGRGRPSKMPKHLDILYTGMLGITQKKKKSLLTMCKPDGAIPVEYQQWYKSLPVVKKRGELAPEPHWSSYSEDEVNSSNSENGDL